MRAASAIFLFLSAGALAPAGAPSSSAAAAAGAGFAAGFESITSAELAADMRFLSSPELEGRDTPSRGLEIAAEHIVRRFEAAGLVPLADSAAIWQELHGRTLPPAATGPATAPVTASDKPAAVGTFLRPWTRSLPAPDKEGCRLVLGAGAEKKVFALGVDFVPVVDMEGEAKGELVFAGFGIEEKSEHYDDLDGLKLRGKIVLIVEGEPDHPRAFDGPELSRAAGLWRKIDDLSQSGAAAVLAVRRAPRVEKKKETDPELERALAEPRLPFRHTWADWVGSPHAERPKHPLPVLEVSAACATQLLGEDVLQLAAKIDKSARPVRSKLAPRTVQLASRTNKETLAIDNVVGVVPGGDKADEIVVVGAHYDHIGVDERGRIGCGADDNASGTAALLEIAQALAAAGPRRTVWCCAFSGEEDGLLGSKGFCQRLPAEKTRIVAMLNMDMIGRGTANEVAVLGLAQTPAFEKTLDRAKVQKPTGVQKIVMRQGEDLFARSDHFSFHQIGIPSLFFFEGLPIERNPDYHTWRDTFDQIDTTKVFNTTRLAFSTTWLISNDDEKPPRPRE